METLAVDFLDRLADPLVNPKKRVFVGYLASALAIALGVQFFAARTAIREALGRLFSARIWWSRSARADYRIAVINQAVMMGVAPRLVSRLAVATFLFESMHVWFDGRPVLWPEAPGWTVAVSFTLVLFLLDDGTRYLLHRWLHTWPVLWCFHRVHHAAETLTPFTVYRTHPVEGVLFALRSTFVQAAVLAAFFFFLGERVELVTVFGANAVLFAFNAAGANLRHSHVRVSYGRFVERFLISPAQHQIHHSADPRHHNRNFGSVLAVWDWMGGSLCIAERGRLRFGIPGGRAAHHGLRAVYLEPLRGAAAILCRSLPRIRRGAGDGGGVAPTGLLSGRYLRNACRAIVAVMRLGFFIQPVHPPSKDYRQVLREDREAVLLADRLEYEEAFIGEHVTDRAEPITSCLMFIASLVNEAPRITFGSAAVTLPSYHPAMVAAHVAMIDHLTDGRFVFGIGPGGLRSDAEVFENLDLDRNGKMLQSIDMILGIWSSAPPYDFENDYWKTTTAQTLNAAIGQGIISTPLQTPHPPIVVTSVSPHSRGLTAAARRGWDPISSNYVQAHCVASNRPYYLEGLSLGGRPANGDGWRIAKSIFVADDHRKALAYAKTPDGPHGFYFRNIMTKVIGNGRPEVFRAWPNQPDEQITLEQSLDTQVIAGDVGSVVEQILSLREQIGDFGTLLYTGHDWMEPDLDRRSMELMATEVMPRVNAALGTESGMGTTPVVPSERGRLRPA